MNVAEYAVESHAADVAALHDPYAEQDIDGPVKLFVGQVPRTMEEDALRPVLEAFGALDDLVIIRDKLTGAHRGCAFASYVSADAADRANDRKAAEPSTVPTTSSGGGAWPRRRGAGPGSGISGHGSGSSGSCAGVRAGAAGGGASRAASRS